MPSTVTRRLPPGAVPVDLVSVSTGAPVQPHWCSWCGQPTAVDLEVLVAERDTLVLLGRATIRACPSCSSDAVPAPSPPRVS